MPLFTAKELRGPWSIVGDVANLTSGECPSLFPLPALTPGTSAKPGQKLPTHVYKRGRMGGPTKLQDHFQLGERSTNRPSVRRVRIVRIEALCQGIGPRASLGKSLCGTRPLACLSKRGAAACSSTRACTVGAPTTFFPFQRHGTDSAVLPDASKDFCTLIPTAAVMTAIDTSFQPQPSIPCVDCADEW